jgi:hypothetical protein
MKFKILKIMAGNGFKLARFAGLLAMVIVLTRIPGVILARKGMLFNGDELIMTLTVLDRFLGVPPAFLSWPGGTLQLLGLPVAVADFLLGMHFKVSYTGFMDQLNHAYREPWHFLFLLRCVVAVVSSLGFALLILPMVRLGVGRAVGAVCILCLCTLPQVWIHSQMAANDALAIGLGCMAAAALSARDCDARHFILAGLLVGLGCAAKITVVPLAAFVLALGLERTKNPWQGLFMFTVFVALGFAFACPYVWTDPVRFAKSVLGNLGRSGEPMGLIGSFMHLTRVVSPVLLLLACLGGYRLLEQKSWKTVLGAVLVVAAILRITSRAGVVFDRYYLVAVIPVTVLAAMGLQSVANQLARQPWKGAKAITYAMVIAIGLVVCGAGTAHYVRGLQDSLNSFRECQALDSRLKSLGDEYTIIMPLESFAYLRGAIGRVSSKSLEDLAQHIPKNPEFIAEFAGKGGVPMEVAYGLASTLNNQEQILSAQLYALAYPRNRRGYELKLFHAEEMTDNRFGILDVAQAVSLFNQTTPCALVLEQGMDGPAAPGAGEFGNYRLWIKDR